MKLDSFIFSGLTTNEAQRRIHDDGFNELPEKKRSRLSHLIFEALREPMVFLLISCGIVYLFLGDRREALMLLGFLLLILAITLYQERKTERSLEALRDLSSPRALVLREGMPVRIPGREVVTGDVVILNEGDRVPADGVILTSTHLSADESLLTGESVPVVKTVSDFVFASTTIVRGQAVVKITATGLRTEVGKIGKSLEAAKQEETFLQSETRRLVKQIAIGAGSLCILIIVVSGLVWGHWLEGFLQGLTLAMAILPNEIPAVLLVFLAMGAWRISKKNVITRRMPAVEMLGAATVLCTDKTGTITLNQMSIESLCVQNERLNLRNDAPRELPELFHEIVEFGILASQRDPFDPMEIAFKRLGTDCLSRTEHLHDDWTLLREYPLSEELMALSHVWESPDRREYVIAAKGSPEAIVDLCHLTSDSAQEIFGRVQKMAQDGLRVLGVAKSNFQKRDLPPQQHDFDFEFLGLVGLADPVRPGVVQAIEECHTAGIRVIMITGDHPETARSVARQIHLNNPSHVLTGTDLEELNIASLDESVKTVHVFARMRPEQKLRLVEALKRNGEVVAMTGDGVNDAPALKTAHIGIAMGARGTDVARESSSLVLLNDDFNSIVEAVKMGRRVFENLKNAMSYLLAVHIPITVISIVPVVFHLPLVLLPVHIAFLHLIIEPACSIVFEAEPPDSRVMRRPPRPPKEPLFAKKMTLPSLFQGSGVLAIVFIIYGWGLFSEKTEQHIRALTYTTLIFANLGLICVNRSWNGAFWNGVKKAPRSFWFVIAGSLVTLALVLYVPLLRELFKISALHFHDVSLCFGGALLSVLWFGFLTSVRPMERSLFGPERLK